jgi:hypothetical protein
MQQKDCNDIFGALAQLKLDADSVQDSVQGQYTCEDTKLLEIIMEHILLHWDDICACLVDEII